MRARRSSTTTSRRSVGRRITPPRTGALVARDGSIDAARPVVFYCRTGSRSAVAAQAFAAAGYDAHNLDGGLKAWVADGLPLEPAEGHVA